MEVNRIISKGNINKAEVLMETRFRCTNCGTEIDVEDPKAGQEIVCPKCERLNYYGQGDTSDDIGGDVRSKYDSIGRRLPAIRSTAGVIKVFAWIISLPIFIFAIYTFVEQVDNSYGKPYLWPSIIIFCSASFILFVLLALSELIVVLLAIEKNASNRRFTLYEELTCPNCQEVLEVNAIEIRKGEFDCPECKKHFSI
jgi:Zn finger protein HypA/HybF involved in hydrogenase expression